MKYYIHADEAWPDLRIEPEPKIGLTVHGTIELTPEERMDWMRVNREYEEWQMKLRERTRL